MVATCIIVSQRGFLCCHAGDFIATRRAGLQTVSEIVTVNCRCSAKTIASAGIDQISYKQCSGAQQYDYQGLNLTGTSFSSTRQIAVDTVQVYVGPPPRSCAAIPLPAFGPNTGARQRRTPALPPGPTAARHLRRAAHLRARRVPHAPPVRRAPQVLEGSALPVYTHTHPPALTHRAHARLRLTHTHSAT